MAGRAFSEAGRLVKILGSDLIEAFRAMFGLDESDDIELSNGSNFVMPSEIRFWATEDNKQYILDTQRDLIMDEKYSIMDNPSMNLRRDAQEAYDRTMMEYQQEAETSRTPAKKKKAINPKEVNGKQAKENKDKEIAEQPQQQSKKLVEKQPATRIEQPSVKQPVVKEEQTQQPIKAQRTKAPLGDAHKKLQEELKPVAKEAVAKKASNKKPIFAVPAVIFDKGTQRYIYDATTGEVKDFITGKIVNDEATRQEGLEAFEKANKHEERGTLVSKSDGIER